MYVVVEMFHEHHKDMYGTISGIITGFDTQDQAWSHVNRIMNEIPNYNGTYISNGRRILYVRDTDAHYAYHVHASYHHYEFTSEQTGFPPPATEDVTEQGSTGTDEVELNERLREAKIQQINSRASDAVVEIDDTLNHRLMDLENGVSAIWKEITDIQVTFDRVRKAL